MHRRLLPCLVLQLSILGYSIAVNPGGLIEATIQDQGGSDQVRRQLAVKGKRGAGFWSVKGVNYYDANGNVVYFSGVQWSGFESDGCAHGLWTRNYKDMLKQIKSVGFNMLRLSFAGETLKSSTRPKNINYWVNKDLKGLNSLQVMDKIIKYCGTLGMKVILDYHRMRLTANNEYGLWFDDKYPESVWIKNWAMLAKKYANDTTVIGFDLFNEVHNNALFLNDPVWKVNYKKPKFNYRRATIKVIAAIRQVNKNAIVYLEGMWNETWWGGNLADVQKYPIFDKYPHKLAYSAHEYGPHVYQQSWFTDPKFPDNLPQIWDKYWGFIVRKKIKPVWVGEFGSFFNFDSSPVNVQEKKWIYKFRSYIRANKLSWTYFQWGPNSKDTGGILKDDWNTVNTVKIKFLNPIFHPNFGPSVYQ